MEKLTTVRCFFYPLHRGKDQSNAARLSKRPDLKCIDLIESEISFELMVQFSEMALEKCFPEYETTRTPERITPGVPRYTNVRMLSTDSVSTGKAYYTGGNVPYLQIINLGNASMGGYAIRESNICPDKNMPPYISELRKVFLSLINNFVNHIGGDEMLDILNI